MRNRRRNKPDLIHGILLLDKPIDMTSNAALQKVKRLMHLSKAGHTGSLDPLASGLLPICIGEATKLSSFLLNADKRYWVEVKLGENTSTGDAEGEVIESRPVESYSDQQIESVLARFRGIVEQLPPMYSAIKHNGQPLYKLARQGVEVERKVRQIHIYSLILLKRGSDTLVMDIHCSKGTYVRTLAEDIGNALGCGGHVTQLRRTEVGDFSIDNAFSFDALGEIRSEEGIDGLHKQVIPMEEALSDWPHVLLTDDAAYYLKKGQPVLVPKAPTEGWVRLYEGRGNFVGVGQILDDGRVAPKRLINMV